MARLVEGLSHFFGRVEILARGLEGTRRAAEAALAAGRPLEAREHARRILSELPGSPLGLALWADAAEDAWLDHEVVEALRELAPLAPWRADVWLRLGRASARIGAPGARDALERAAVSPDERESARLALIDLCDLDLEAGDPQRALRWLDRIPVGFSPDLEVQARRAECALALGDVEAAREAAPGAVTEHPLDGRLALVRAKLAAAAPGEPGPVSALDFALRAYVLEARGASELLSALVAGTHDAVLVDRARRVVAAAGELDRPSFAAAFAFAEGRRADAREALIRGLVAGDAGAEAGLLRLATETRDMGALDALAARAEGRMPPELATLREARRLAAEGKDAEALDALDAVSGDAAAWAADLRREFARAWLPPPSAAEARPAAWRPLLFELRRTARALDRVDLVGAVEALAVERERPLRVAVMGEFNAGKSTFLNALLGVDVAPTGVLPTTATLHWVAWAPDPFARVVIRGAQDRLVPHAELKRTLSSIDAEGGQVERVFIYAPIERLKRVEILDTPGHNAPNPEHIAAARQAVGEAHVAIWLLDATGPLKESERKVLVDVRDEGVPVQVLVNKADRLSEADLERVLAHVAAGLEQAGISSHAPPVAFSARLSLAGKLGDEGAMRRSRWAEVEELLSTRIVDASDLLKERALRRKAGRIARELSEDAAARAAGERQAQQRAREEGAALRAAAARLGQARGRLAAELDKALTEPRRALGADLRPLEEIPPERQQADPAIRAYVRDRFVARLADGVVQGIAAAAEVGAPPRAAAAVRAVLLGAASAAEPPELAQRPLARTLEACVEAFAGALLAEADRPEPPAPIAAVAHRAEALAEAFARS